MSGFSGEIKKTNVSFAVVNDSFAVVSFGQLETQVFAASWLGWALQCTFFWLLSL